jgi:WD40 repeat protein
MSRRQAARRARPTVRVWGLAAVGLALWAAPASPAGGAPDGPPGELHSIAGLYNGQTTTAWSPDGMWVAAVTMPGYAVTLWRASTGERYRTLPQQKAETYSVAFSPDGQLVACAGKAGVRAWDVCTGKEVLFVSLQVLKKGWAIRAAFSPDNRRLAVVGAGHGVAMVEVPSGKLLHALLPNAPGNIAWTAGVTFSPDGRRLAAAGLDGKIRLWDVVSGNEVLTAEPKLGGIATVVFSPNGRHLALGLHGKPGAAILETATGQVVQALGGHASPAPNLAYSRDGRRLATAGRDRTVRLWDTTTWREQAVLPGHTSAVTGVAFAPEGGALVSVGGGVLKIWGPPPVPDR